MSSEHSYLKIDTSAKSIVIGAGSSIIKSVIMTSAVDLSSQDTILTINNGRSA